MARRKTSRISYAFMAVITMVLAIMTTVGYFRMRDREEEYINRCTAWAEGTVEHSQEYYRKEKRGSGRHARTVDIKYYKTTADFEVNGRSYQAFQDDREAYSDGEQVRIFYDPADPTFCYINNVFRQSKSRLPMLLAEWGMFIITVLLFVFYRKN
ncbi:MAG: DUF3592 domain-containing protein [Ruminococcus sp.]|nr:DUF3592 domain-containing protein [Ruminococcus sp.]